MPLAETEQARLNESVPKKKAIRHEKKIESFGKPAAQLTDAGGSPAGSSHYQEPLSAEMKTENALRGLMSNASGSHPEPHTRGGLPERSKKLNHNKALRNTIGSALVLAAWDQVAQAQSTHLVRDDTGQPVFMNRLLGSNATRWE